MKKLLLIISVIILLASLALVVKAHSGKTDSNGGHYDSSTGEYHYHHGYSAHSHYDMDGDGDLDCPYDFDDKTGVNSGSKSTSNSSSSGYSRYDDNVIVKTETITKTVTKEVPYIPPWIYWVIGSLIITIIVMSCVIKSKCNERAEQIQIRELVKEETNTRLADLQRTLIKKHGKNWLCFACNAPDDEYIGEDNLPHSSEVPQIDRYTFYLGGLSDNSRYRYHHISCRYGRISLPVNAYTIRKSRIYHSCSVCHSAQKIPDIAWVERYQNHYSFLSKYIEVSKQLPSKPPKPVYTSSNEQPSERPSVYISWRD